MSIEYSKLMSILAFASTHCRHCSISDLPSLYVYRMLIVCLRASVLFVAVSFIERDEGITQLDSMLFLHFSIIALTAEIASIVPPSLPANLHPSHRTFSATVVMLFALLFTRKTH